LVLKTASKEDIPRLKNLDLITEKRSIDGIEKLIKFYEKDATTFATIISILLDLKYENNPEKEILWKTKRSEIFDQFPITEAIQTMDWEKISNFPYGPNYLIWMLSDGQKFVKNDSVSENVSKLLNILKKSNKKLDEEVLRGLTKIIKLYENDDEITKTLIETFENFHISGTYVNDSLYIGDSFLLAEPSEWGTKSLLKHLLDFSRGEITDGKISANITGELWWDGDNSIEGYTKGLF